MFYNSIFSSKDHSFKLYSSEDGVISHKNMHLNLDKVSDESSWWSVFHKFIPFTGPHTEKEIAFHGDLIIDDKKFENIHGECTFMADDFFWFKYDNLYDLEYKIYNSENELLFEFHADFSHVDDNGVNHIHQDITDLSLLKI
jgi:hypothetical protein